MVVPRYVSPTEKPLEGIPMKNVAHVVSWVIAIGTWLAVVPLAGAIGEMPDKQTCAKASSPVLAGRLHRYRPAEGKLYGLPHV